MNIYIWNDANFGAYHADGSATVIASSLEEAIAVLQSHPYVREKITGDGVHMFAVIADGPARVVTFNYGCDC